MPLTAQDGEFEIELEMQRLEADMGFDTEARNKRVFKRKNSIQKKESQNLSLLS